MPENRVTFVGNPGLTFVNYGDDRNFTYRREARIHNGHQRVLQTNLKKQMKQREAVAKATARKSTKCSASPPPKQETPPTPQDALSSFARDPFAQGITSHARALESVWLAAFEENFYLPGGASTCQNQPVPSEFFLSAARLSRQAYQNLVVISAAKTQARRNDLDWDVLLRQQAASLQEFRNTVDLLAQSEHSLSGEEVQDLYSAAYSFFGLDFGKEPAYNAVVYANCSLVWAPRNRDVRQLPTVEWIRTLMPRPSSRFAVTPVYKCDLFPKIGRLLDFVEEAQDNALKPPARAMAKHFQPGTSLHCILTAPVGRAGLPGPYPEFDLVCLHRVLFQLHLHLADVYADGRADDELLRYLESLASNCLSYDAPAALRLFLWGMLTYTDSQSLPWAAREQRFTFAMKEILMVHNISFADDMLAWLMQEGDGHWHMKLPRVDVDGLRWAMRGVYAEQEPDSLKEDTASTTTTTTPLF